MFDTAFRALDDTLGHAFDAHFATDTRLYRLEASGPAAGLLVESWSLYEQLSQPWEMQLSTLSTSATLDIHAMLGHPLSLITTLADGSTYPRRGLILGAGNLDSDGGFTRYRLTVQPWLALLKHSRRSAVWQDRTVMQIVDSVFAAYPAFAAWRWSACARQHLERSPQRGVRPYVVQYRETDLAFVQRLLAREGLVFRFESAGEPGQSGTGTSASPAPGGHTLVILADTTQAESCPEDASSAQGWGMGSIGGTERGIRFHAAAAHEGQDAIQAFGATQAWQTARTQTLGWDYGRHAAHANDIQTPASRANPETSAPRLASFEPLDSCYATGDAAEFADYETRRAHEALEAPQLEWSGYSTVRTFDAGRQFTLNEGPAETLWGGLSSGLSSIGLPVLTSDPDASRYTLISIVHAGVNNLPASLSASMNTAAADTLAEWVDDALYEQARAGGYANRLIAVPVRTPWKVPLYDGGQPCFPAPRPGGPLSATVVGPNGETSGSGSDEIHTDALGRLRIRFDFQAPEAGFEALADTSRSSLWVRAMQRHAGSGMGWQFTPRLGQEVLVDFHDGNIERPYVIGALYNGQGEAGVSPTPGGRVDGAAAAETDRRTLSQSTDHRPSAQGNRIGRGHSPAWHATPGSEGHGHAGALNGIKTKEFGVPWGGYNQLVFDDSPQQLRVQLATTQYATQLNLGHLVHQADNHRGSLRGVGFELRSDAYGAVRAAQGLLVTTYGDAGTGNQPHPGEATPAGDNAAGMALAGQLKALGQALSQAATTHQSTALAGQQGSLGAEQSHLAGAGSAKPEAPFPALHTALKGMVPSTDFDAALGAAQQKTTRTDTHIPATTDPIIALHGRAGWATVAGMDAHLSAAGTLTVASGEGVHWATGGAFRLHSGQSLGMLAGALDEGSVPAAPGTPTGTGLTLIAAQGDTVFEAQSGPLQVASKDTLTLQSQSANIDWAAAKKITIANGAGASIVIEGGNLTFECPGTITVKAGQKQFVGGGSLSYAMPVLPAAVMSDPKPVALALKLQDSPGSYGAAPHGQAWRLVVVDRVAMKDSDSGHTNPAVFSPEHWQETLYEGTTGSDGSLQLTQDQQTQLFKKVASLPGQVWLVSGLTAMPLMLALWSTGNQANPQRQLDALNFAPDGRSLEATQQGYLEELAIRDAQVRGIGNLKTKTDI